MITAEEAHEKQVIQDGEPKPLAFYKNLARNKKLCSVCESSPVWRLGNVGMCFPCTTGETDASEDFELIPE